MITPLAAALVPSAMPSSAAETTGPSGRRLLSASAPPPIVMSPPVASIRVKLPTEKPPAVAFTKFVQMVMSSLDVLKIRYAPLVPAEALNVVPAVSMISPSAVMLALAAKAPVALTVTVPSTVVVIGPLRVTAPP